jgi:chromosome partitioning protein
MTRTVAVINQKGGVGKTTTAVNIAAQLAKRKKNVLLIDLDPQGNASSGLGFNKKDLNATTYNVLMKKTSLSDAIQSTTITGLYILPTDANLAASEVELVDKVNREKALESTIKSATHDFIIIDCPPALGLLTINALATADSLIIPVQTEYYALEGLGQLLDVTQRIRENINPRLELLGVVLTMYDKRTSLSEQVANEVRKHFGDKVFKTVIPRNVKLAEAPSFGKTIFEHDKWSKGAKAYKSLTSEILTREGIRK